MIGESILPVSTDGRAERIVWPCLVHGNTASEQAIRSPDNGSSTFSNVKIGKWWNSLRAPHFLDEAKRCSKPVAMILEIGKVDIPTIL